MNINELLETVEFMRQWAAGYGVGFLFVVVGTFLAVYMVGSAVLGLRNGRR